MINLEYLAAFVAAAEKGSFSAAGRHIGKSQSTVSVSINNLELDLGITLFDRSGKYPTLTPEGEHLYQQAKVLIRQAERIEHYSSEVREEVENRITIGVDPLVPFALLETALEKLARKFPFTQVQIVKEKHDQLFEKLGNDELDFALHMAAQAIPDYFEFACVLQVAWTCVCSPDSEFSDLEVVSTDLLTTERQILCTSMHEHPIIGPISTLSQSIWLAHDQDDMIRMVEQDIGWAILPTVMLEERVSLGTIKEFKPEYMKAEQYYGVDLLWKGEAKMGPACEYFRQLLFAE